MFALFALGFFADGALEQSIQLFGSTIPATFTVASHWLDKKGNENYSATYEYELNGAHQVSEESITAGEYYSLQWTDPATLVTPYQNGSGYAVDQPTTVKVLWLGGHVFVRIMRTSTGPFKFSNDIWNVVALVGALFLISYYPAWVRPLRYKRLVISGRPIMGTITGKRAWRGRNSVYFVNFQFTPPGAPEVNRRMTVTSDDYNSAQIGEARAILYDPENPDSCLIYAFGEYKVASGASSERA